MVVDVVDTGDDDDDDYVLTLARFPEVLPVLTKTGSKKMHLDGREHTSPKQCARPYHVPARGTVPTIIPHHLQTE